MINKKIMLIIGLTFIISGFIIYAVNCYFNYRVQKEDENFVEQFMEQEFADEKEETEIEEEIVEDYTGYLAVLEIPKIDLKTGVVMSSKDYSTMNRNVSIYPTSDMPNYKYGNTILFAHNGTSKVSYFRNIDRLEKDDVIFIYYDEIKYSYKVIDKYYVKENSKEPLMRKDDKSIITLITCKKGNNRYRLIIVGEKYYE
ncbi:MAG: sortase [bacterium]|nr:sortase [bacterium]